MIKFEQKILSVQFQGCKKAAKYQARNILTKRLSHNQTVLTQEEIAEEGGQLKNLRKYFINYKTTHSKHDFQKLPLFHSLFDLNCFFAAKNDPNVNFPRVGFFLSQEIVDSSFDVRPEPGDR